jgi:hypothetical protein
VSAKRGRRGSKQNQGVQKRLPIRQAALPCLGQCHPSILQHGTAVSQTALSWPALLFSSGQRGGERMEHSVGLRGSPRREPRRRRDLPPTQARSCGLARTVPIHQPAPAHRPRTRVASAGWRLSCLHEDPSWQAAPQVTHFTVGLGPLLWVTTHHQPPNQSTTETPVVAMG